MQRVITCGVLELAIVSYFSSTSVTNKGLVFGVNAHFSDFNKLFDYRKLFAFTRGVRCDLRTYGSKTSNCHSLSDDTNYIPSDLDKITLR